MNNLKCTVLALTMGASLFIGGKAFSQVPSYVPTNGLVGWWPFNGNANDESGNGNNGTVNGAIMTANRNNLPNSAYYFNGLSDYIQCLNSGPSGNPTITLSFWVKTNQSNYGTIFSYGDNGGSGNSLRVGINGGYNNNTCAPCISFDTYDNAKVFISNFNNIWDNYIVIYDGTLGNNCTIAKIYKNGILLNNVCFDVNLSTTNISALLPITFGKSHLPLASNSGYFMGYLDDIGFWNRSLSQQEITDLYNANNCSNDLTITPLNNLQNIGGNATFTAITSDPSATYIWQSDLGQGFQSLNNYGNYSGVNTNTLTVSNVQLSEHNQQIRAISTSGNCIDTSNIATIQIADTCITNVTVYDTLLTTVTDTLIINTTLSLPTPNNENTILIYPNPASDHITIDNGNYTAMAGYTIKIENNAGQQVFQSAINQQQFYVDLSTWTGNGLYFVHLIDAQNNTLTVRKIVLQ